MQWTSLNRFGSYYATTPPAPALLVFVHGIFATNSSWGATPALVLQNTPSSFDILNYEYPALPWQRGSIDIAADGLRDLLMRRFASYQHIVFIAHSTGGLVVKHMLRMDRQHLESVTRDESTLHASILFRTRRIVNFCVPHAGGNPFQSIPGSIAYILLLIPILIILKLLDLSGNKGYGLNTIGFRLIWRNPWARRLERDFLDVMNVADRRHLPRPTSVDYFGHTDNSVRKLQRRYGHANVFIHPTLGVGRLADNATIAMRGSHFTVKLPQSKDDPILRYMLEDLADCQDCDRLNLLLSTIHQTLEFERLARVRGLLKTSTVRQGDGALADALYKNQYQVYKAVVADMLEVSSRSRRLVITGDAGVGKTVVLMRTAKALAAQSLRRQSNSRFPVLLLLQDVYLDEPIGNYSDALGKYWEKLLREWLRILAPHHPPKWVPGPDVIARVLQDMRNSRVGLLFDSIDEFLLNHSGKSYLPQVTIRFFASLFPWIDAQFRPVFQVATVRASQPGIMLLPPTRTRLLEVTPLSEADLQTAELKDFFGPACDALRAIRDARARKLLLTPLILSALSDAPELQAQLASGTACESSIMRLALEALLLRAQAAPRLLPRNQPEVDSLLWSLCLAAWVFFSEGTAALEPGRLAIRAKDDTREWLPQLRRQASTLRATSVSAGRGFARLRTVESAHRLFTRTVFVPSGPKAYRFRHKEWQDYLVARYLALAVLHEQTPSYGPYAFTAEMFRIAGQQLPRGLAPIDLDAAQFSVTKDHVLATIARAATPDTQLYLSNFAATIGNSDMPVNPDALDCLLDHLDTMRATPMARHVVLNTLAARALRREMHPASVFRPPVLRKLDEYANPPTELAVPQLTISLAKHFRLAFAGASPGSSDLPLLPLPGSFAEAKSMIDTCDALSQSLSLVARVSPGQVLTPTPVQASLQRAFIQIQSDVLFDSSRTISAVHYLYPVVLARIYGVATEEAASELPTILDPANPIYQSIASFAAVPNCRVLYDAFRAALSTCVAPQQRDARSATG